MTVKKYGKILVESPRYYSGRYEMDNFIESAIQNLNSSVDNYYVDICKYNQSGNCVYNASSKFIDYIKPLAGVLPEFVQLEKIFAKRK